jgi:8-oxo-dGTP diphosphatase
MTEQTEEVFLAEYDPNRFPPSAITADVAAFSVRDGVLCVLGIERANHPFRGRWALPGTFPEPKEDAYDAAVRALTLRTGIVPSHMEQLATYTDPDRDPRMRIASVAYLAFGPFKGEPKAGYHASKAEWLPVHTSTYEWAFDHKVILHDAVTRLASKIEYTPLITRFLPETFTIPDILDTYEAIWNRRLDAGNFYRKVKASKGFVEPTGKKRDKATEYRAGSARLLYPPIRAMEEWA